MSNLKPTNDFVFKKLFGEEKNVDILKDLIQSILPELKIAKVVVNKDVSLERKLITDKLGILDVMATLNNNRDASRRFAQHNRKINILSIWSIPRKFSKRSIIHKRS